MATRAENEETTEIRCPECSYFLAEMVEVVGLGFVVVVKVVCRSCRSRLLLTMSPGSVKVGQVGP